MYYLPLIIIDFCNTQGKIQTSSSQFAEYIIAHCCLHIVLIKYLMNKLAVSRIMMVSVFRPDTGGDLLFDRDFNVNSVAFFLVLFVALLVWDLFAVGNRV